jgi:long-chain acyl-CoA synthetase
VNVSELLLRTARVYPDAPALFRGEELLCSYREFVGRAMSLAAFLRVRMGLSPGDRVALCMTNCPEYLEVLYGSWIAGLVVVPINAKLHPYEVRHILENSQASVLFVSDDLGEGLEAMLSTSSLTIEVLHPASNRLWQPVQKGECIEPIPRRPEDVAWLFYTSGTTGRAKGVMLTQRNLLTMSACYFMDVDTIAARILSSTRHRFPTAPVCTTSCM